MGSPFRSAAALPSQTAARRTCPKVFFFGEGPRPRPAQGHGHRQARCRQAAQDPRPRPAPSLTMAMPCRGSAASASPAAMARKIPTSPPMTTTLQAPSPTCCGWPRTCSTRPRPKCATADLDRSRRQHRAHRPRADRGDRGAAAIYAEQPELQPKSLAARRARPTPTGSSPSSPSRRWSWKTRATPGRAREVHAVHRPLALVPAPRDRAGGDAPAVLTGGRSGPAPCPLLHSAREITSFMISLVPP
jgi:hypothetical protein